MFGSLISKFNLNTAKANISSKQYQLLGEEKELKQNSHCIIALRDFYIMINLDHDAKPATHIDVEGLASR